MRSDAHRFRLALLVCVLAIGSFTTFARAETPADCEQAGRDAEQKFELPSGLLLAIGRIESGHWNADLGRMAPWPWSVDVNGVGRQFDSSSEAISATRAAQAAGQHSIDVGCYQISLLHHPDAFASLDQAFDPKANALYAAQFLASLHARLGSWEDATAAYHSSTTELGLPYRQRVFATWSGAASVSPVSAKEFPGFPGIKVWSPGSSGAASVVVPINAPSPQGLPRVITPSQ
jgi:hypothetical protein